MYKKKLSSQELDKILAKFEKRILGEQQAREAKALEQELQRIFRGDK